MSGFQQEKEPQGNRTSYNLGKLKGGAATSG